MGKEAEKYLEDICPNHTDKSEWNKSEVIYIIQSFADQQTKELREELEITDKLLNERQKVLDAIPECSIHGKCVPHAIEWIEEMKKNNARE